MTKNKAKEDRMADIISAAVEEFIEKGYEGASMNSIAARSGLSKGGLYYHYNSKDEILIEANKEYMKPINDLIEKAVKKNNPAEGLRFFIENYLKYWKNHEKELVFVFLSLAKVLQEKKMWSLYDESYAKEMISFYESLYIRGVETGIFRPHNTRSRAITLFSALDGMIGYLVMCRSLPLEDTISHFVNLYVDEINIYRT